MTIYYVSNQRGSDLNDGLSPSSPWLTVTKAVQTLVAGDTCYIGSGIYREKPVNVNTGTDGNIISFIGDFDSQFVVGDKPGIVRVTGCGEDDLPTTGTTWTQQKDYVHLENLIVDGCKLNGVLCTTIENRTNKNVVAIGGNYGFGGGTNEKCLGIGGYYGFNYCITNGCLGIGGNAAFYSGTNKNSIGIGYYCFYSSTNVNCLGIGGNNTFNSCTNTNCLAIGGNYSFNNGTSVNCLAFGGNYGYTGGTLTNCKVSMCRFYSSGVPSGDPITEVPVILFSLASMQKLLEAFEPWMFEGAKQWGDITADVGTEDILGRARRMLGGGLDIGPYAFSNVQPDFTNYQTESPAITINTAGMKIFEVPAKANIPITVTVQSKWLNSTLLPQIILKGDTITTQTANNTTTSDTWQALTVTATPTKDEILKLYLIAQDNGTLSTLTTVLAPSNSNLVYTAKSGGTFGDDISIAYVNAGASKPLAITLLNKAVSVQLATDASSIITSTANDIKTAIEANKGSSTLVSVALASENDGTGIVTTLSATNLSGGVDSISYFSDITVS